MKAFRDLGFQRTMYDEQDLRTSARKENTKISFLEHPVPQGLGSARRGHRAGAAGTEVEILMVTESEYFGPDGKDPRTAPAQRRGARTAPAMFQARCNGSTPVPHPTPYRRSK